MVAVNLARTFHVAGCTRDEFAAHLDRVMQALLALEGDQVHDSDMSVDFAAMTVTLRVLAQGESETAAALLADSVMRAAIHAAEGATPGWQSVLPSSWEPVGAVQRELVPTLA